MAGAEPAAVLTPVVTGLLPERNAAEMGTDADDDQPFRFLNPIGVPLWIPQLRDVDFLRSLDLLPGAVGNEDGLAAPGNGQTLTLLDRCDVHLGGGQSQGVARRVHGVDKRPDRRCNADAGAKSARRRCRHAGRTPVSSLPEGGG